MMSVDLPEPETPVTQVSRPSGISHRDVAQVVAGRADDAQLPVLASARRAQARQGDLALAAQVLPGDATSGFASISRGRALRDDLAAVHAGARARGR